MAKSVLRVALAAAIVLLAASAEAQQLPTPHAVGITEVQHTGGLGRMFASGTVQASASLDGHIFALDNGSIWSVPAGGVVGSLGKPLRVFCLSANGEWLAFAEGDTVKIWTLASGNIRDFARLDRPVERLTSSPDGTILVAATAQGGPELFDMASGNRVRNLVWSSARPHLPGRDAPVAFSPDGRLLAYGSEVWTVATGISFLRMNSEFQAFSRDGRSLYATLGKASAEEWDLATRQRSSLFDLPSNNSGRFSIDPAGRVGVLSAPSESGQLTLWDMHAGLQTGTVQLQTGRGPLDVVFLGNSDWLLAGNQHTLPRLVRISTREVVATLDSDGKNWSVVRASDGAYDASPAALVVDPRMNGGLSVDGIRVEQSSFHRVAGLLRTLPGAPGVGSSPNKPQKGRR